MTMPTPRAPVEKMRIEAADQRYNQTDSFIYLGGTVSETPDVSAEISIWTRACWLRIKKYAVQLYDRPTVPLDLKARMVKAEAVEALLYGCCCCFHHINRSGPNHIHKQKKHCTQLTIWFVVCWTATQIAKK